ncbi:MAG: hypothetical protein ABMA26_07180 [Limisphaerales bacterium]
MPDFDIDTALISQREEQEAEQQRAAEAAQNPPRRLVPVCPLRRHLRQTARTTFFYPGCGVDFGFLRQLHEYCDTFVYCDYGRGIAEVEDPAYGLNAPWHGLEIHSSRDLDVSHLNPGWLYDPPRLTAGEVQQYEGAWYGKDARWGREYRLTLRDDPRQRELTLFYLHVEAYAAYVTLFKLQRIAPWGIALVGSDYGFAGCNWIHNRQRTTPLGRAVHENRAKPQVVALGAYFAIPYDWDWTGPHKDFSHVSPERLRFLTRPKPARRPRGAACHSVAEP